MENLFMRSISGEALRAELHRADLLAEAANSRRLRVGQRPRVRPGVAAPGRARRSHAERPR